MKKLHLLSYLATTLSISILLSQAITVQAQTVNCPVGYTCTPIVPQQSIVCPIGYTCSPVALNVSAGIQPVPNTTNNNTTPVMLPGLRGTVSSLNVTSITVNGTGFGQSATTTFNVFAWNIPVRKNHATTTLESVMVGDGVFVQGSLSSPLNITATSIHDHGMNWVWQGPQTSSAAVN